MASKEKIKQQNKTKEKEVVKMQIFIKTKKQMYIWKPKKLIKNVAIAGTITTIILAYVNWFINYQAYLQYLMNL